MHGHNIFFRRVDFFLFFLFVAQKYVWQSTIYAVIASLNENTKRIIRKRSIIMHSAKSSTLSSETSSNIRARRSQRTNTGCNTLRQGVTIAPSVRVTSGHGSRRRDTRPVTLAGHLRRISIRDARDEYVISVLACHWPEREGESDNR